MTPEEERSAWEDRAWKLAQLATMLAAAELASPGPAYYWQDKILQARLAVQDAETILRAAERAVWLDAHQVKQERPAISPEADKKETGDGVPF